MGAGFVGFVRFVGLRDGRGRRWRGANLLVDDPTFGIQRVDIGSRGGDFEGDHLLRRQSFDLFDDGAQAVAMRDDKNVLASRNVGQDMIAKEGESAGIRIGEALAARWPDVPRAAPRLYLLRAEARRRFVLVHAGEGAVVAFIERGVLDNRDLLAVQHAEDDCKCLLRPLERRTKRGIHRNIMQEMARALALDPELVFLDELTTGLDPQARRAIWDLVRGIRQRGKTVFLTTHLMEEAERLGDRVAIIDHGRIVGLGAPADLVRRHCPERTAIVTTEDVTAAERFRAIPQVRSVTSQGLHLTIRGSGDDLVGPRFRGFRFPLGLSASGSTVAVARGNLTVTNPETPQVISPASFAP